MKLIQLNIKLEHPSKQDMVNLKVIRTDISRN